MLFHFLSQAGEIANLKVVKRVPDTSSEGVTMVEVTLLVMGEQTQVYSPLSVTIWINDLEQLLPACWISSKKNMRIMLDES